MSLLAEEVLRFSQAENDKEFVLKEIDLLRRQFPDQYIGVVNREVKYHDTNLDNLLDMIRSEMKTTKGVFVFFVPSGYRTIAV
ncbi:MAG: hypothetical protein ABSD49_10515 [Candidatus Bathyarchaeia archaeon]|jgi:protein-tyrosine phosphatase